MKLVKQWRSVTGPFVTVKQEEENSSTEKKSKK